ncbi:protein jim lovell [Achroia grisella]|uniref:protein jim lovell n=1 Tax=Achroia grisella TaxID=688607 RepID=UPI0027D33171|nr:protein jim lovell [Achroia grisella]
MKMMPQQYCLRWKHHHSNVQNMFAQLLEKERFCDVTLYCSPNFATQVPNKDTVDPQNIRGVSLRAHRVVLAACSELLGALLGAHEAQGEPVLVIDGAEPRHLKALLDYMYTGEMNVHHSQLASLLKTAEELRIKGLTDIRWNNKDEPPDCDTGVVTAVPTNEKKSTEKEKQSSPKHTTAKHTSPKLSPPKQTSPKHASEPMAELRAYMKKEDSDTEIKQGEKFSVNGGPPPLIKLPTKDKTSPAKRDRSDSESPSPKRRRATSGTEHTDDDSVSHKSDRDQEWQHGNLDISAERVEAWGMNAEPAPAADWSRDASDDEWADAPADIGSFLHTRLRVDGDNSADEESNESAAALAAASAPSSSSSATASELKMDYIIGKRPKSGPSDPRFTDVVKLSDYLQHGRRPQFWEENYVKRVMEAVRVKELEMKQAAEILGVSYGTLYGRYRDVYGCINRPYRTARDFWQAKGPSEVLDRLQRGELSLDAAALALGVSIANLSAYITEVPPLEKEFEPIPIEIDPSLKLRARTYSSKPPPRNKTPAPPPPAPPTPAPADKPKKVIVGSITDEDPIPATVITTHEGKNALSGNTTTTATTATSGKWPSIRVASLDTLRGGGTGGGSTEPASPSQLMRSRPDLTIVAARRPDTKRDDNGT